MVKKILSKGYLYFILFLLYAPLLVLFILSFTEAKAFGQWNGFSLEPYKQIFVGRTSTKILSALRNTLIVASIASAVSTFLGTLAAIGIFNMKNFSKKLYSNINQIPIVNAEIVSAVSLMVFFASIPFIRAGWITLIIGHITFCTPYVLLSVMPRLQQLDPNIYEAALDLGATPGKALRKVLIPIIKPGIISGFILAFTLSLDDFVITIFNNGSVETLSTYIWKDAIRNGLEPSTKALSTLVFVLILIVLIIVNFKKSKKSNIEIKENKIKEEKN
jgi:spermidine/putrescine transport system permease protein